MWEADRDNVAGRLELADETVHVGRRMGRRRAIVVDYEDVHLGSGFFFSLQGWKRNRGCSRASWAPLTAFLPLLVVM